MKQIWKPIPTFIGYEASNKGHVRSYRDHGGNIHKKVQRILAEHLTTNGYVKISLMQNRKLITTTAHRLVALAFIGEPPSSDSFVCHNNGIKTDNRLENLRYDDRFGNMKDAIKHGTIKRGQDVNTSRLTEKEVILIRELYATERISWRKLAKMFGVVKSTIGTIVSGKNWKHLL